MRFTGLTPLGLAGVGAVFLAADIGAQHAGAGAFPAGPLDESAHLLTALLVLWAIGGVLFDRLLVPVLIASVAIDLDHLPAELGQNWLTAGTPRPYTHSLLTIAVVLVGALVWRRRRTVLIGVALGLALHFFRDMAEPGSGVALLWPFSDASFSLAPAVYLLFMGTVFAVGLGRSLRTRPEPVPA